MSMSYSREPSNTKVIRQESVWILDPAELEAKLVVEQQTQQQVSGVTKQQQQLQEEEQQQQQQKRRSSKRSSLKKPMSIKRESKT